MISFQEILNLAHKIPPDIIEKDYCLTWFLYGLSNSVLADELVFYGGTALRKIYFQNYRYSEDLDFISDKRLRIETVVRELDKIYRFLAEEVNINFKTLEESIESSDDRIQFYVGFDGFPEIALNKQIRFDLLVNQKIPARPVKKEIVSPYSDRQKGKILKVYSLESIAADKILAIAELARKEPRDIYDLNYLLKDGDLDLSKIYARLKQKSGYVIPFSAIISSLESDIFKKRWELRLKNQIADLPDMSKVIGELKINLGKLYGK